MWEVPLTAGRGVRRRCNRERAQILSLSIGMDGILRGSCRRFRCPSPSLFPWVSISNGLFWRLQRSLAHPLHYVHGILYISTAVLVFCSPAGVFLFSTGFSLVFRLADDRTVVHLFRACSVVSISAYLAFCVFCHLFSVLFSLAGS